MTARWFVGRWALATALLVATFVAAGARSDGMLVVIGVLLSLLSFANFAARPGTVASMIPTMICGVTAASAFGAARELDNRYWTTSEAVALVAFGLSFVLFLANMFAPTKRGRNRKKSE